MKQRPFFGGLSWLLFLNLLIKPAWIFFIDREVQNVVGHETYGRYFALLNLCYVLLFLADAGLTNLLVQQVSSLNSPPTRQLFRWKCAFVALYLAIGCLAAWAMGLDHWSVFIPVLLIQALGSLALFLRGLLSGHQFFTADAVFSIADKALMILFCFPFLYGWWQPITLGVFLQLQLSAFIVVNLLLLAIIFRKGLLAPTASLKPTAPFRKLLPFSAVILLMAAHYRLDGFLLERLRPDGTLQAGIYALGYRLLDAANMVGYLTASFLLPFVARHKANRELLRQTLNLSRFGLLTAGVIASCFALVFPAFIQQLLYHTDDAYINRVIQLILAVLPAYFVTHIYGTVLTAMNALGIFIRILVGAVFVNLTLNVVLIPLYGAAGSAVAALVSQYGCAAGCYLVATRKYILPSAHWFWLFFAAAALGLFIFLSAMKAVIHSVWIILALSVLLMITVVLLQRKKLVTIVRSLI